MDASEILKKVKRIEIKANRQAKSSLIGHYQSSFKGRGMTFSEVRPYSFGDDVRAMDWNKTAYFNEPFVKVFEEERELSILIVLDISSSSQFSTHSQEKNQNMVEIAATLAMSAIGNQDKVGLLLFSDEVDFFSPPAKGKKHVLRLIRETVKRQNKKCAKTNIGAALEFLMQLKTSRQFVFLISDFLDENYAKAIQIASKKHKLTAVRVRDEKEFDFPDVGWIPLMDMETGAFRNVNTSSKEVKRQYQVFFKKKDKYFKAAIDRCGMRLIDLKAGEDYHRALLRFFQSKK